VQPTKNFFNIIAGIQLWTVPKLGFYEFVVSGASGGDSTNSDVKLRGFGGMGAKITATFELKRGDIIAMMVGRQPQSTTVDCDSGGGGGTFIIRISSTGKAIDTNSLPPLSALSEDDALIIAGGGGGIGNRRHGHNASGSEYSLDFNGENFNSGDIGGISLGGLHGDRAGGGGSFSNNGQNSSTDSNVDTGGKGFKNGGLGGDNPIVQSETYVGNGGFGGGGAAKAQSNGGGYGGGGGGGYSGGFGGDFAVNGKTMGGGGSSYVNTSTIPAIGTYTVAYAPRSTNGQVLITRLGSPPSGPATELMLMGIEHVGINKRRPVYDRSPTGSTPEGWTMLKNAHVDDDNIFVSFMDESFKIAGTAYNGCWVGSNNYITFGYGSNLYSGLNGSTPPYPKIHLSATSDNSYQYLSSLSKEHYTRIRYEGYSLHTIGTAQSNIIWEMTFVSGAKTTTGFPMIEFLSGITGRDTLAYTMGIASAISYYDSTAGPLDETSYVFRAKNADGTDWEILSGYSLTSYNIV